MSTLDCVKPGPTGLSLYICGGRFFLLFVDLKKVYGKKFFVWCLGGICGLDGIC